jgi:hypothetical protein
VNTAEVRAVAGVPESALPQGVELPPSAPLAPWTVTCEAIVWYARSSRDALPAESDVGGRAVAVCGGFVQYRDTPVGPYGEVFGGVALRKDGKTAVTIPFMAVDSPASVVGGRRNWALPKTLATFGGSPTSGSVTAEGPGWRLRATARALGVALPVRSGGRIVQRWPDGELRTTLMRARGRARPALVTLEVESDGPLPSWLRPGRHLGAVVPSGTFTFPAAT